MSSSLLPDDDEAHDLKEANVAVKVDVDVVDADTVVDEDVTRRRSDERATAC